MAAAARGGALPHLFWTDVSVDGGKGVNPGATAHGDTTGNPCSHPDFAPTFKADGTDVQLLAQPL